MVKFCRGDLVWGKMPSYPWWPAIVLDPKDCGRDGNMKNNLWLFWFGDHKITELSHEKIVDFKEGYTKYFLKKLGKKYHQAVEEILTVIAMRHKVEYVYSSSLYQWAASGFKTRFTQQVSLRNDLPEIVLKALERDDFKRKCVSDSDDDDSDEEIENLVSAILKGSKHLEDICISCCKTTSQVVVPHPLFIGGVCHVCKKNVDRIFKLPFGRAQDMCIICGQGGTLVYCSNTLCLRSFCQLCIEFLAPKGSYSKILRSAKWLCYLCKSDPISKCLIKARENFKPRNMPLIPLPKKKFPIRVIAHCDEVLTVLKDKKLAIGKYCTGTAKPLSMNDDSYKDFSYKEFFEISADLVCDGYFTFSASLLTRKESVESFFTAFYRFLFRLNNARLVKSSIFFIFVTIGEIVDDRVLSRVVRFLEIEPVSVQLEEKTFFVWSNIPNCSSINRRKLSWKIVSAEPTAEKRLFSCCVEPLLDYFIKDS